MTQRTAVINQIRGFLLERGLPVRQGATALRLALPDILSRRSDRLSPQIIRLIEELAADWRYLDTRVASITKEIDVLADQDVHCRRLMSAPGVGPIISSAMVAAIGTGDAFEKGRDFAAWLGLVPKQISTGDRTILGRISKRGHSFLRTLFVQGARAVLLRRQTWPKHGFAAWLEAASKRLHPNVLVVALAAKLARIAWSLLAKGRANPDRKRRIASKIGLHQHPAEVCETEKTNGRTVPSAFLRTWFDSMAGRGRRVIEDRNARISMMARGESPKSKPDTLAQTAPTLLSNPTCNAGVVHRRRQGERRGKPLILTHNAQRSIDLRAFVSSGTTGTCDGTQLCS